MKHGSQLFTCTAWRMGDKMECCFDRSISKGAFLSFFSGCGLGGGKGWEMGFGREHPLQTDRRMDGLYPRRRSGRRQITEGLTLAPRGFGLFSIFMGVFHFSHFAFGFFDFFSFVFFFLSVDMMYPTTFFFFSTPQRSWKHTMCIDHGRARSGSFVHSVLSKHRGYDVATG